MPFKLTEEHITDYHMLGYTVFERIIPDALLTDLRRETDRAREIAYRITGRQAQRLQPLANYDLDLKPFQDYGKLQELNDAIHAVLTPRHFHADLTLMGVLLEPADHPWCTNWHRDWRDHMPEEVFESEFRKDWDYHTFHIDYLNQINCALYEDPSTWIVPGSHYRQQNTLGEIAARDRYDRMVHRQPCGTYEEQERACLDYCRAMPGAVQLRLNAGDFALYRSSAWHLGNYVPYRKRATIHDFLGTPDYRDYLDERAKRKDAAMKRWEEQTV